MGEISSQIPGRVYQDLASSPFFSGFSVREIRELCSTSRCSFKTFHREALVAFRSDSYDRLLLLSRGTLIAEIVDDRGTSLKVESLTGPTPVATAILFSTEALLPVQLRAETDVELLSISRQGILDMCREDERFLTAYLRDAGDKVTFLAEKIRLLRFTTIRQKIAGYFLDLLRKQGTELISLPYNLEVTADMFGVTRPALSRSLSQLVEDGILGREAREYRILKKEKLKEMLSE